VVAAGLVAAVRVGGRESRLLRRRAWRASEVLSVGRSIVVASGCVDGGGSGGLVRYGMLCVICGKILNSCYDFICTFQ